MASFVSTNVRFRVYLRDKLTGAGGEWADFGDGGQYDTKDAEIIELLEKDPAFNIDFVRVSEFQNFIFQCPKCEYEKKESKRVIAHAMTVHKIRVKQDGLIKKRIAVGV